MSEPVLDPRCFEGGCPSTIRNLGPCIHGRPTRTSAGRLVAAWWPLGRRAGAGFFGRSPLLIRFGMQHKFIKVHDALMVTNQRLRPLALVPLCMDGASGAGQFRAGEAAKCACQTGWVLKRAWWRRWKIHLIFHVEGPVKRDQRSTSPYPMEVETLQTKKCKRSRYFPCRKRGCFCGRRFNVATGYPLLWEMLE